MQTTSALFTQLAQGDVRPLSWQLRASFDKTFDPTITFFELDTSLLDGPDILSAEDSNVINEWDKYVYTDYSNRVISIEITNEEDEPYSVVQSYADITLNNYDGFFTPGNPGPIGTELKPQRPFRLLLGFGNENVQQFIGLSTDRPEIDRRGGTASFHLIDFLTFIFQLEVGSTIMEQDISTGDALAALFQSVGLTAGQYVIDETSFNRIPWFYIEKGQILGEVVRELMEVEQGRVFMDELGTIRFLNRQNFNNTPVYTFDRSRALDFDTSNDQKIINYMNITVPILEQFDDVPLWSLSGNIYLNAGETVEVWSDYPDPVVSVDAPVYSYQDVESSHFYTSSDSLGSVPNTSVDLVSIDDFSKASLLTFENTGSTGAYIQRIELWGSAVRQADEFMIEDFDQTSIDDNGKQQWKPRTTKYLQKESRALGYTRILIDDYKDYGDSFVLPVKGNMALQIGDVVDVDVDDYVGEYRIKKIVQVLSGGRYNQILTLRQYTPREYFIISSDSGARSLLDGTDVLA